ncbi:MAG: hypothetical protein ACRDIV_21500 [Ktedonobacteraceae bacterium]
MQENRHPYGDNFALVIPVEDEVLHTVDKPFCWDITCICKSNLDLFTEVQQFIQDGLLTIDEAFLFYCGRTV